MNLDAFSSIMLMACAFSEDDVNMIQCLGTQWWVLRLPHLECSLNFPGSVKLSSIGEEEEEELG